MVKLQFITLVLADMELHIGYTGSDKSLVANIVTDDGVTGIQVIRPLSKLLTPPDIQQLAYDLYKLWAKMDGPELVAEWASLEVYTADNHHWSQYVELIGHIEWLVRSYR